MLLRVAGAGGYRGSHFPILLSLSTNLWIAGQSDQPVYDRFLFNNASRDGEVSPFFPLMVRICVCVFSAVHSSARVQTVYSILTTHLSHPQWLEEERVNGDIVTIAIIDEAVTLIGLGLVIGRNVELASTTITTHARDYLRCSPRPASTSQRHGLLTSSSTFFCFLEYFLFATTTSSASIP